MLQQSALIYLMMAPLVWLSFFHIHRAAGVDPHNPQAAGGKLASALKATLVLLSVSTLAAAEASEAGWVTDIAGFFGMFALAQTVGVPFVSGGALTVEEEPSAFRRLLFGLKQSVGGGLLLKLIVLLLAFLLPDSFGLYAVIPVILLGAGLVVGKLFTATGLRDDQQPGDDHQGSGPAKAPPPETANAIRMALAYVFGCVVVLVVIQQYGVVIDPGNWMGWTGFIAGAMFGRS